MTPSRAVVLVVAVLVAFSFVPSASAAPIQFITGNASFNQIVKLPPHATMYVDLLEQPPNLPQRLATQEVYYNIGRQTPPYNFALDYDAALVFQASNYVLSVTIADGRKVLYRGSTGVLTYNRPTNVQITLVPSTGYLPKTSAGMTALVGGLVLAALAAAVYVFRQRRQGRLVAQFA